MQKKYIKNNEDIIVSSDLNYIQRISDREKVKFFKRPKKISGDKADVYFAVVHALSKIKNSKKYKYIALLQVTSPLRPKNLIFNAIKILKKIKFSKFGSFRKNKLQSRLFIKKKNGNRCIIILLEDKI